MLSEKLKELRNKNGKTQAEISETLGITQAAYLRYEKGTAEPNLTNLVKLADMYQVTTDYLLRDKDNKSEIIEAIMKEASLRIINDMVS